MRDHETELDPPVIPVGKPRGRLTGIIVTLTAVALAAAWWFVERLPAPVSTPAPGHEEVPAANHATKSPSVQVMKPERRTIAQTLTIPGNVSPWYQTTLYAKVPGYLKEIRFDKGDVVTKGQLLAVIDAPEIDDQYRQAQADYAIKRLTYERMHRVWKEDPDVIAKQDVDTAEAAAEAARHLRDGRKTLLDYTRVIAPFTGTITARFADPGALIQAATGSATQATPLFTLMDVETVRIYANVPQESAGHAKPGIKAVLTAREFEGKEIQATLTRSTGALDPVTRTLLVEIYLPNSDHALQPGMYVNVTLYLQERNNALAIAPAAIVASPTSALRSVFVVEQGRTRQVPVKTGADDGRWVEILEGLTGTEDVVVVGKAGLQEGQPVSPSPYNLPQGKPSSQKL
jgi:RND family efflux transporter MFP subunit